MIKDIEKAARSDGMNIEFLYPDPNSDPDPDPDPTPASFFLLWG